MSYFICYTAENHQIFHSDSHGQVSYRKTQTLPLQMYSLDIAFRQTTKAKN